MRAKKGVSAVVATVLIIMITVAAVGIIWGAVMPLINNSIDKADACFNAQKDLSVVTLGGYTCYNSTSDVVYIQVERSADASVEYSGVQVLLTNGGNTVTKDYDEVNGEIPNPNGKAVLNVAGVTAIPDEIAIAPVLTIGNTAVPCDGMPAITIEEC